MTKLVCESLQQFIIESLVFPTPQKPYGSDLGNGLRDNEFKYDNGDTINLMINQRESSLQPLHARSIFYVIGDGTREKNLQYRETGQNTNEWTISINMPNVPKDRIKLAFERVNEVMPQGAIITENKTISTDGLRTWAQQLKHGYTALDEKINIPLSGIGLDDFFKEFQTIPPETKWAAIKFKTPEDAQKAKEKLENILKQNQMNFQVSVSNENSLLVTLPKLKKL